MQINTASQVLSLTKQLEEDCHDFYLKLSQKYPEIEKILQQMVRANRKIIKQIEQAYYSVITDAMEGGFAFDIDASEYSLNGLLEADNLTYKDAIEKVIAIENIIINFYNRIAEQSNALMADLPRVFRLSAKKRKALLYKLFSEGVYRDG